MADNKQDLPEKPIEETPQEAPKEEKEEEFIDESKSESLKDFLGDEPVEEVEESEEEKVETPEEEEKPLEPTPEPSEPEIPLEEVAEEVRADEREKVKEKILDAIDVKKEKEMEEEGYISPWKERGEDKPASWEEQQESGRAYDKFMDAKEAEEEEEKAIKVQEEMTKIVSERGRIANEQWNSQIEWLVEDGQIPTVEPKIAAKLKEGKVLTKAELNDPGVKAQREIFEKMYDIDQLTGGTGTKDAVHVYTRYVKTAKSKKPAGAKAPVSGGRVPISVGTDEMPSYEEDKNLGFDEIINE